MVSNGDLKEATRTYEGFVALLKWSTIITVAVTALVIVLIACIDANPMKIAVLKEQAADEQRVSATPETVKKFIGLGATLAVEQGAGESASIADAEYAAAGAGSEENTSERQSLMRISYDVFILKK